MGAFLDGGQVGDVRVVLITAPDSDCARSLARELVGARLAACATVVPGLSSIYRWDQELREDSEVLLLVKTTAPRLEALGALVARLHPYDVPELVALRPAAVERSYLAWLLSESTGPEEPRGEGR
jgi:periplasmic divalent cation tolerance protein